MVENAPTRDPRWLLVPAVLLLVYWRSLGTGFLSDDFLFLSWAAEGWGELLAQVTVDSYPQVVRPLPALVWPLGLLPEGALWLRCLSLSLHTVNALLIASIVRQQRGSLGQALGAALLFALFPLSTETVCWVSAAPDLWATAFALGVLRLATSPQVTARAHAVAAVLFLAALLSKESILLLPLIVLTLVWSRASVRRLAAGLGAVAAVYVGVRWLLFAGLGGYLDTSGRSLATNVSWLGFARASFIQAPLRALTAFKDSGELWPALAAVTAMLVLLLLISFAWRQVPRQQAALAAAGLVLALLPAAPVLSVGWDHEGSRLLYWPVALLCVYFGSWPLRSAKLASLAGVLLVLWFSIATAWNVDAWIRASERVEGALAAMERFQRGLPRGSTVLVDTRDTYLGAYVFRNGLAQAAAWRGLRADLVWRRGSAAVLHSEERRRLGQDVFEIEPTKSGEVVDRTTCARALVTGKLAPLGPALFVPEESTPVRLGTSQRVVAVRVDFDRPLAHRCWPRIEVAATPSACRFPAPPA